MLTSIASDKHKEMGAMLEHMARINRHMVSEFSESILKDSLHSRLSYLIDYY